MELLVPPLDLIFFQRNFIALWFLLLLSVTEETVHASKDLKCSLFVINCAVGLNELRWRLIFHIYIYPEIHSSLQIQDRRGNYYCFNSDQTEVLHDPSSRAKINLQPQINFHCFSKERCWITTKLYHIEAFLFKGKYIFTSYIGSTNHTGHTAEIPQYV